MTASIFWFPEIVQIVHFNFSRNEIEGNPQIRSNRSGESLKTTQVIKYQRFAAQRTCRFFSRLLQS